MRSLVIFLFLSGLSSIALAKSPEEVSLNLKLEANNEVITQQPVTAALGKKSFVEKVMANATYIIEFIAKKDIDNQVYLDFTLRRIFKGKSIVISHPRIITLNNQEAVMDEGDSATSADKNVILSVTPHILN
jgi:hypothetical protein